MKPGDVVTFKEPHAKRREAEYGPGPYLLDKPGPDHYWIIARMNDGVVHDRAWFHQNVLQLCVFLTAAKEAVNEAKV